MNCVLPMTCWQTIYITSFVSEWVSEWVIVVYRQFSNLSAISWGEQVNIQWDDDEVRFVLDQQAELDFYSDIYQSMGRHVALHGHLIQIPSQPVFAPFPYCCVLSGEATNTNFYSLWFVPIDARTHDLPQVSSESHNISASIILSIRLITKFKTYIT